MVVQTMYGMKLHNIKKTNLSIVIGLEALTIRKLSFQQARAIPIDNYDMYFKCHNYNIYCIVSVKRY